MITAYLILLHQIIAHIALLALFVLFPVKYWLITLAVYSIIYCFGGTITYHRLLSHNSFKAPTWFYYLGTILGILTCSSSPMSWVATHRKHHRYTDKEQDPHSMRYMKWYKIQWLNMLNPAEAIYVMDMLRSPFQRFVHRHYFSIHIIYSIVLALINPELLIYFYLAPAALAWEFGSVINTVCHKWGYKNHDIDDDSRNNKVVSWLAFGEGLHNNHHAKPADYDFKHKSGELDVGGFFIKLIKQKK